MYTTVKLLLFVAPEASVTVMVIGLLPEASGMSALQAVVPLAVPLSPVAAFDHVT